MTTTEATTEIPQRTPSGWKPGARHAVIVLVVVVSILAIRARWFSGSSQAAPVTTAVPAALEPIAEIPVEPAPAEPAAPTMIGSWRDDYYGERTMTFRPDGTGLMLIKLNAVGQAVYGEKLLFHLKWENRDGVLVMQFTGGEPKDAVATISKLWGDKHEQKIELLTESDLHLRSTDSQNLYMLKHVELE